MPPRGRGRRPRLATSTTTEDPGLLFVHCTEAKGRPSKDDRSSIKHHVAHVSLIKNPQFGDRRRASDDSDSTSASTGSTISPTPAALPLNNDTHRPIVIKFRAHQSFRRSKPHRKSVGSPPTATDIDRSSVQAERQRSTDDTLGDPTAIVGDSCGAVSLPFTSPLNLSSILNWFFYKNHLSQVETQFKPMASYWEDDYWVWSREHELMLDGVALHALRKRLGIIGGTKPLIEYERHKTALIQKLRKRVDEQEPGQDIDRDTLFAIANLATCSLIEGDSDAASLHIEALKRIDAEKKVSAFEWTGFWTLDLRNALITGKRPKLSYHLPPAFRHLYPSDIPLAAPKAAACAALSPRSFDFNFLESQSAHFLAQLFQLFSYLPESGSPGPLAWLYDMEYEIRVIHAELLESSSSDGRDAIELFVLAIQLSIWIGIRFWEPISTPVRLFVVRQALRCLSSLTDVCDTWDSLDAHPTSLIWALATISGFALDHPGVPLPIPALVKSAEISEIYNAEDFISILRSWPWSEDWHPDRALAVWHEMEVYKERQTSAYAAEDDTQGEQPALITSILPRTVRLPSRLFLGPVEFYNP